jgi:hypothetical protein
VKPSVSGDKRIGKKDKEVMRGFATRTKLAAEFMETTADAARAEIITKPKKKKQTDSGDEGIQ